jgi:acyl-CoA reductase-like NAD-dependent aldehyde dehydrogenase
MASGAYKTGTRAEVIRRMASYAIRDQEALIDVYTPRLGKPDDAARLVIAGARDAIADFKSLAKTARSTN